MAQKINHQEPGIGSGTWKHGAKAGGDMIASSIEAGPAACGDSKPRLLIETADPDRTVDGLIEILTRVDALFERGVVVRTSRDQHGFHIAHEVTPTVLVTIAHRACRPYRRRRSNGGDMQEVDTRLPLDTAKAYCELHGERRLPTLNGIASTPLLRAGGAICSQAGFDKATGILLENVPDLRRNLPELPARRDAEHAFKLLRQTFATFCFADAAMSMGSDIDVPLVDTSLPPGQDESTLLTALLTAVCRPSLDFAPGILIRAAAMSGAGSGKGLLARCICLIAFGREPHAVTLGEKADEREKRLVAELIGGGPVLFLDNLNNTVFKSDLLASALTERPARVRVLGKSRMLDLNASAFTVMTGNGLSVSEDLARRFLAIELDAQIENPESRHFEGDIRAELKERRGELLGAALTIWRWGQIDPHIPAGLTLGGFEQWGRWVRDPLLALGCRDPVERIAETKQRDTRRQSICDLFDIWWNRHGDRPVAASALHDALRTAIDPQERGRQFVASQLNKLAGTRMAGFVLARQQSAGKWGYATYALNRNDEATQHRGHRGHGTKQDDH